MTTKGIQFYVYISNQNINVSISIGKEYNQTFNYIKGSASFSTQQGSFEIGSTTYGIMSEDFSCTINQNINGTNNPLFNINQSMSPLTGGVGTSSTDDLWNMMNTPSQLLAGTNANFYVSYGFYQAGVGGQHQFYVYVSDVYTTWMADLVSTYNCENTLFNNFILPGAHDSGMCNGSDFTNLSNTTQTYTAICNAYGLPVSDVVFNTQLVMQTITNLSFTQKDTITMLLNLGIRFFDFRPGYLADDPGDNSNIYHQHMVVPGYSFFLFLQNTINWLNTNTGEIVVVYLNYNGFSFTNMQPISFLETYLNTSNPNGIMSLIGTSGLNIGGSSSLSETYQNLKNSNTRLIFLNNLANTTIPNLPNVTYVDSYTDAAYQDSEVEPIINQLTNTINNVSNGDIVLLQLQGTITGTIGGILNSISTSSCSSQLMATKANYDYNTYAFLGKQWFKKFCNNGTFYACINDFADNALVSSCINLTAQNIIV